MSVEAGLRDQHPDFMIHILEETRSAGVCEEAGGTPHINYTPVGATLVIGNSN